MQNERGRELARGAWIGALSGVAGVAVMTVGEKIEQAITKRPDSYLPARTLLALLGRRPGDEPQSVVWNHVMHYGTGALLGLVRGVWSVVGMRGPVASAQHTVVRLAFDQTLENGTGVGAPPTSWPRQEQVIDVLHKTVYSFATGLLTDLLLPPRLQSGRGRRSH